MSTTTIAPLPGDLARGLERRLRGLARMVRRRLAATIALGAAGGFLLILQAWLLARVIDRAVIGDASLAAARPVLAALLGVFALRAGFAMLAATVGFEAGARVRQALRAALLAAVEARDRQAAGADRTGAVVGALVDNVEELDRYFSGYLPQATLAVLIPAIVLAFVAPADWISAIIMIATAPLIPVFMILIGKGTERLNQRQWRRLARMSAHFFDLVEGLTTLKLFDASRRESDLIRRIADDYRRGTMEILRVAFLSSLILEFFATIGIAMVAVFIGFRLYYGQMDFLQGFFVLLLAPEFYRPLRAMGTQYHARMQAIAASERVLALLDPRPDDADAAAGADAPDATPSPLPPRPIGSIGFEAVEFAHPGRGAVLQGASLVIMRGERIGIVGPSGAGKTTIGRLLLGLIAPQRGRVVVDGRDLRGIDPADWFARIAWVPQTPTLFHGSVAENIRLGRAGASDADIRRAAEAANADAFIAKLPDSYDTLLGDRGQGLSGGQIRRIALARAFLKPAEMVVLDEPTAGLDDGAARLVTEAVARLGGERIVVIIAHQAESLRGCDRILTLDDGRIIEATTAAAARAGARTP